MRGAGELQLNWVRGAGSTLLVSGQRRATSNQHPATRTLFSCIFPVPRNLTTPTPHPSFAVQATSDALTRRVGNLSCLYIVTSVYGWPPGPMLQPGITPPSW